MTIIEMIIVCSHLQFGSNPTADVPMTNQLRPMHASVILDKAEHTDVNAEQ